MPTSPITTYTPEPNPRRPHSEQPLLRSLAEQVRDRRKTAGLTQRALAGLSGTGVRFIVDLEQAKPTLEVGKLIDVLETLGLTLAAVESRPLKFEPGKR